MLNWRPTTGKSCSKLSEIEIKIAEILATTLSNENTYGAVAGRVPAGLVTFAYLSTDNLNGEIKTYVGEGGFTPNPLNTFGSRTVVEVPGFQKLLKIICKKRAPRRRERLLFFRRTGRGVRDPFWMGCLLPSGVAD
jgi:L-fucose isomerase-like protein